MVGGRLEVYGYEAKAPSPPCNTTVMATGSRTMTWKMRYDYECLELSLCIEGCVDHCSYRVKSVEVPSTEYIHLRHVTMNISHCCKHGLVGELL